MELASVVGVFFTVLILLYFAYFMFMGGGRPEKRRVKRRLRTVASSGLEREAISILRKTTLSDIDWLDRILVSIPFMVRANRLLEMANARYSLGVYLMLSFLLAALGFLLGMDRSRLLAVRIALLLAGAVAPFVYLYIKKVRRMQKFERQLPDALDLVARSLKAGHAFSSGMKMTADEFDDPIGTEFGKTLDEINFGVAISDALKGMAHRVDVPDLKFFVVSVIIQRETGGNLAEIMESLAQLIRERFKLHGKVKVLAAEGKISASVLLALPFFLVGYFLLAQPDYVMRLIEDPIGHYMIGGASVMMLVGTLVIRQMIQIRV